MTKKTSKPKKTKKRKILNLENLKQRLIAYKKLALIIFFIVSLMYLIANIYSSQSISSLFIGVVNDEKPSVIEYLKKIRNLPIFKQELKNFSQIFGKDIIKEVLKEEEENKIKIKQLELALKKNPNSPQIFYALSILYNNLGDKNKAQEYLKKAQAIDPLIK
jgi:tetratricopeptide (TPR) repeat protein